MRARASHRARAQRPYVFFAMLVAAGITVAWAEAGQSTVSAIPAGTRLRFQVDDPVASSRSVTGRTFSFELVQPIALGNTSIPIAGTMGIGTIVLAGHPGTSGHARNLSLRLDRLMTPDGRTYAFDDQRLRVDAFDRNVRIESRRAVETILARPATVSADLMHV